MKKSKTNIVVKLYSAKGELLLTRATLQWVCFRPNFETPALLQGLKNICMMKVMAVNWHNSVNDSVLRDTWLGLLKNSPFWLIIRFFYNLFPIPHLLPSSWYWLFLSKQNNNWTYFFNNKKKERKKNYWHWSFGQKYNLEVKKKD